LLPVDEQDTRYLERAMELAETRRGCTSPNPLVGAVVAAEARVLGEGYHLGPGRDHAEVAAMKDALRRAGVPEESLGEGWPAATGKLFRGTTMYVNLEPCCTYGRTPPCTDALIAAGFGRVVVGAIDPSPEVNGRGLDLLQAAGIQVDVADGPTAVRAKRQNGGMRKAVTKGLPFVTYKYAMTLDGRTATDTGDSRWISSAESRALVHQWRAWSDAVVVGAGTALVDDPTLTARDVACERQPLRVVVDQGLSLAQDSNLVRTAEAGPVVVVCGAAAQAERRAALEAWGVETAAVACGAGGAPDPVEVCRFLLARGAQTVLLEGGPTLAGAWWSAGLIDRVAAFVAPRIVSGCENRAPLLGGGVLRMEEALALREVETERVGPDVLISGYTGEAV
jgi:diaminohydroxyphosphoribosylaminopyrimidine deaminase/5-amino-6-(5-phosphoribosylamino)uracil reductase